MARTRAETYSSFSPPRVMLSASTPEVRYAARKDPKMSMQGGARSTHQVADEERRSEKGSARGGKEKEPAEKEPTEKEPPEKKEPAEEPAEKELAEKGSTEGNAEGTGKNLSVAVLPAKGEEQRMVSGGARPEQDRSSTPSPNPLSQEVHSQRSRRQTAPRAAGRQERKDAHRSTSPTLEALPPSHRVIRVSSTSPKERTPSPRPSSPAPTGRNSASPRRPSSSARASPTGAMPLQTARSRDSSPSPGPRLPSPASCALPRGQSSNSLMRTSPHSRSRNKTSRPAEEEGEPEGSSIYTASERSPSPKPRAKVGVEESKDEDAPVHTVIVGREWKCEWLPRSVFGSFMVKVLKQFEWELLYYWQSGIIIGKDKHTAFFTLSNYGFRMYVKGDNAGKYLVDLLEGASSQFLFARFRDSVRTYVPCVCCLRNMDQSFLPLLLDDDALQQSQWPVDLISYPFSATRYSAPPAIYIYYFQCEE